MFQTLLGLAHTAALIAIAFALVVPGWRTWTARGLCAAGGTAMLAALVSGGTRTLAVEASFAAFRDGRFTLATYPIETVTAEAWQSGVCGLGFALFWAFELRRLGRRQGDQLGAGASPFFHPLLLAFSGIALVLLFEKTAAPEALVRPVAFERAIFPASIAASALLAIRLRSVKQSLIRLCIFVSVARWPLAGFGTLATQNQLGTSLDVHSVVEFADPFRVVPMRVVAHSTDQLAWLLWGPHLLVFPALYLLSAGGVAFAVAMFVLHPPESESVSAPKQTGA